MGRGRLNTQDVTADLYLVDYYQVEQVGGEFVTIRHDLSGAGTILAETESAANELEQLYLRQRRGVYEGVVYKEGEKMWRVTLTITGVTKPKNTHFLLEAEVLVTGGEALEEKNGQASSLPALIMNDARELTQPNPT